MGGGFHKERSCNKVKWELSSGKVLVVDGLLRAAVDMKARPEDALQNSGGQGRGPSW